MSKVIDCFIFYDEYDMLDLKLHIESPVVDKFIVAESTFTHQGKPKPLYFDLNKVSPEFHSKIEHTVVSEIGQHPWFTVAIQRDGALWVLENCKDDDIILITDVDEIFNPEALSNYHHSQGPLCMEMDFYYYYLNCKSTEQWTQAVIAPYGLVKSKRSLMDTREFLNGPLREQGKVLHNAGWHFSYVGGAEKIIKKLETFYHEEYNNDYFKDPKRIEQVLNEGKDLFERDGIHFQFVDIDSSYPQYILDNQERYEKLGFIKAKPKYPKYSIIIPTYKHLEDCLKPCITSLLKYTDMSDKELIIVANGCGDDGTYEYTNSLGLLKTHWYTDPLGYPKAVNAGIKAAEGDYIILLNNDIVLTPQPVDEWIRKLYLPFMEDVKVGITGPNQLYSPHTKRWFILFYCAMIKKQLFDEIGLLDESFSPGFGEDIDFCFRAQNAGYKIVHVDPNSVPDYELQLMVGGDFPLHHHAGITIKEVPDVAKIIERNEQLLAEKHKPKVSIVIPTYNHCDDLLKPCIDSLIEYTNFTDKEVIVVANGCTDGTKDYIESLGPLFKLVWSDIPLGYTKATNEGIKASKGEYVILLNNDIILMPQFKDEWIDMLLDPFYKFANMGITGPLMSYFPVAKREFLVFCCVMIKRKLFDKIGLLDEVFSPGSGEDTDFCFKAMDAGYQIMRVPEQDLTMTPYDSDSKNIFVGDFPFYHVGEGTLVDTPDIFEIVARNTVILESRYKKGEDVVEPPKFSIVIPTYNHLEDCLKPCLESIIKHTDLDNLEVLVVANGCKDGTREYVESLGEPFKLVWFEEAIGYTRATNEGIKAAWGEYVVLLNNDIVLLDQPKNQWLEMLVAPFESDASVGMTGPMKVNDKYIHRDFLIFFCVMTRRRFFDFDRFGLLDEVFSPGFGEDVDFCMRLVEAGYRLVQVPVDEHSWEETVMIGRFPIYHAGEQTFNDDKDHFGKVIERNSEILKDRYNIHRKPVQEQKPVQETSIWQPYPFTEEQRNIRGLKLNLGCSIIYLNDFINIDINNDKADIESNVKELPMFKDNTVALILNTHLIEHFNRNDAIVALKEWYRVLKPGGWLITEAPDVDKCMRIYLDNPDPAQKYQGLCGVFGMNWISIYMAHLWGYSEKTMEGILRNIGFTHIVSDEPAQHQGRVHNFRLDARK